MTCQHNLHGHYCSSSSLCNKPKTSRFSGWITEQQLPITATQTESHRAVSGPRGSCFWRVMKTAPSKTSTTGHSGWWLGWVWDVLNPSSQPKLASDQSYRWWSECAGSHSRLPEWAGLLYGETPHTLCKRCTWLTQFLWMLLNQIWILWISLLYMHKVSPAVGLVRCETDHLPLSDHPDWAEQQEPTGWCKIHQFDSWN